MVGQLRGIRRRDNRRLRLHRRWQLIGFCPSSQGQSASLIEVMVKSILSKAHHRAMDRNGAMQSWCAILELGPWGDINSDILEADSSGVANGDWKHHRGFCRPTNMLVGFLTWIGDN